MTEPVKIGASDGGAVGVVEERCPRCYHDEHGDKPCPEPVCACEGEDSWRFSG